MNNNKAHQEEHARNEGMTILRVESVISRYPIHRLANKGNIRIQIERSGKGDLGLTRWHVDFSSRAGQPGPLAYKLDTRVINRRIEGLRKPIPALIRLGSLHDIAEELELGRNTASVRKALLQNVGAIINARIRYQTMDRTERTLEAVFSRYSVIFTGENLPDGTRADAVYLLLNDLYRKVLNDSPWRPLDYEYLRTLAPGPQRFYEIVSFKIYPAVSFRQRAKLLYSEFCMFSTLTRYFEFDQVKKQMYKIHLPHIKSGYIEQRVEYVKTTDPDGNPDWEMLYTPGPRAYQQQKVFNLRSTEKPAQESISAPLPEPPTPVIEKPKTPAEELVRAFYGKRYGQEQTPTASELALAEELLKTGIEQAQHLIRFAAEHGRSKDGFPNDFGGVRKLVSQALAEFSKTKVKQSDDDRKKARIRHEDAHREAYRAFLGSLLASKLSGASPGVYEALSAEEESVYTFHKVRAEKSTLSAGIVADFHSESRRVERLEKYVEDNPKCGVPGFWDWDAALNPTPFAG